MIKLNLTVLFIVAATSICTAQKLYKISLENELLNIDNDGYYVESVIDERKNTSYIGWVQTGILNKKRFATLENELIDEIYHIIVPENRSSEDLVPIRVAVTNLQISELTKAMKEYAQAQVGLTFYALKENEWLPIAKTFSTMQLKDLDVTARHPENIVSALEDAIKQFSQSSWREKIESSKSIVMESKEFDASQVPIFAATDIKNGIYKSFKEFYNNEPGITEGFEVKEKNRVKLWMVDEEGKRSNTKNDDHFGFAHNGTIYKKHFDYYLPLEKKVDGFYYLGPATADANSVSTGAILGGAIGASIAAASTAEKVIYKLDLYNGAVIPMGYK